MKTEIFFGRYYFRQAESYLPDIQVNNKYSIIDENTLESMKHLDNKVKLSIILRY